MDGEIRSYLSTQRVTLRNAKVDRVYRARGWVVDGRPALSISLYSKLIFDQDLFQFWGSSGGTTDIDGIWVDEKASTLKGEVVGVVGPVRDHRSRLLALTSRTEMHEIIANATDDEPVVKVLAGPSTYDYVASALDIILRMEDFKRFGVDSKLAASHLRLSPWERSELLAPVAEIVRTRGLIARAYRAIRDEKVFLSSKHVSFAPTILFAGSDVRTHGDGPILAI